MGSSSMFHLFLFVCALQVTMSATTDTNDCTPLLLRTHSQTVRLGCSDPCKTPSGMAKMAPDGTECVRPTCLKNPKRLSTPITAILGIVMNKRKTSICHDAMPGKCRSALVMNAQLENAAKAYAD
uniref:Putative secreted protein n=1 Tax=Amblyomma triste TaxID=251400 RepID=A0A023G293_AMBTT